MTKDQLLSGKKQVVILLAERNLELLLVHINESVPACPVDFISYVG